MRGGGSQRRSPVTSYGVILVKLSNISNIDCLDVVTNDFFINHKYSGPLPKYMDELFRMKDDVKFLLVRRKHSLGYMEFIRGRYDVEDIAYVTFLLNQMVTQELRLIKVGAFDKLWNSMWSYNRQYQHRDYITSRSKFIKLKNNKKKDKLNTIISNIDPFFAHPEWGCPKGRKERNEPHIDCAKREFMEETGFLEEDFEVMANVDPYVEIFTGTDDIIYKHVYYVAYSTNNRVPTVDNNNLVQKSEIGDIGYFNYNDCVLLIRDRHIGRLDMIHTLYCNIAQNIIERSS